MTTLHKPMALFITQSDATVFTFTDKGIETFHMEAHGPKHFDEVHGKNHPKQGNDADHFYCEVAKRLLTDNTDKWLIMGPGVAKNHFKSHIERHHHNHLTKIMELENMERQTDGELSNFARDFFQKKHLIKH